MNKYIITDRHNFGYELAVITTANEFVSFVRDLDHAYEVIAEHKAREPQTEMPL